MTVRVGDSKVFLFTAAVDIIPVIKGKCIDVLVRIDGVIETVPDFDTCVLTDAIRIGELQPRIVGVRHIENAAIAIYLINCVLPSPNFTIDFLPNPILRDKGTNTVS